MDELDRAIMRLSLHIDAKPELVDCPKCGATPGVRCKRTRGADWHTDRMAAAKAALRRDLYALARV